MIPLTDLNWGFLEILYLIIIFIIGFLTTCLVLPFIIKFMIKKGHVGKDIHKNAQPEVAESGGISIIIGFSVASVFLMFFFPIFINEIIIFVLTVILAGIIGLIDDKIKLRSRYKIFLIIFTGSLIFVANYVGFICIESPTLPFLGKLRITIIYPIIIPLIVAIFANTVNMLEGYNGEGSGTCLIASCFLFICGLVWNSTEAILFTVVTIAVLIPFFLYNKYPSKVFPGDVGTLSMGVMIAGIALFGSLEVAVFCALLIHVFNSFYVLYSVKGFFESDQIQKENNDIILLENDQILASDKKKAVLTLPRLILAKGALSEPELVKNFYAISIICGFFSIVATMFMVWTIGNLDILIILIVIIIFLVPSILLLYYFPRIRGIITLMIILLVSGIIFMIIVDLFIMSIPLGNISIIIFEIPINMLLALILMTPGLIIWYFVTIKYFFNQLNKMKLKKNSKEI